MYDGKRTQSGPERIGEPVSNLLDFDAPHSSDFPDETWNELRSECREIDRALAESKLAAERHIVD